MAGYTHILVQGVTLLRFVHSGKFRYLRKDVTDSDIICNASYTVLKTVRNISIAKLTLHKIRSGLPNFTLLGSEKGINNSNFMYYLGYMNS